MYRYRSLEPEKIVETLEVLSLRIDERIPGAGLSAVCRELTTIARECTDRIQRIRKPILWLRLITGGVLGVGVALLIGLGGIIEFKRTADDLFGVLQGLDAAFNVIVLMGAGAFFLVSAEERYKRRRILADLHELRSIVHVIDMHQLTKDPSTLLSGQPRTTHSPERTMTEFELSRYLDYCSEMLSLTAKVAALYAQTFRDPVVISNVNEIEQLTTNLARKIWQKIMVLRQYSQGAAKRPAQSARLRMRRAPNAPSTAPGGPGPGPTGHEAAGHVEGSEHPAPPTSGVGVTT